MLTIFQFSTVCRIILWPRGGVNGSNEGLLGKMALTNFLWEKLGYVRSGANGPTIAYDMYISEE
jgi:hypothetical protein